MSFRVTAALLAVLIILGGVVYYVTQQPAPGTTGAANSATTVILSFAPASVTKLTLTGSGKTTEVDNSGGNWLLGATKEPADSGRIGGWVNTLANLTADRTIENASDLATYGLATPKLTVTIAAGDTTSVVDFGDKTPDGNDYYVRLPKDAAKAKSVYLVSSYLGDDLLNALATPPKAPPTPTAAPTLVPGATLAPPPTPAVTGTPAG